MRNYTTLDRMLQYSAEESMRWHIKLVDRLHLEFVLLYLRIMRDISNGTAVNDSGFHVPTLH